MGGITGIWPPPTTTNLAQEFEESRPRSEHARRRGIVSVCQDEALPAPMVELHRYFAYDRWVDEVVFEDERMPWWHEPGELMRRWLSVDAYEKDLTDAMVRALAGPMPQGLGGTTGGIGGGVAGQTFTSGGTSNLTNFTWSVSQPLQPPPPQPLGTEHGVLGRKLFDRL